MAYEINLTDGALFATVPNGTLNRDSNLVLIGKNYAGYGEFVAENFIHILENAAHDIPPPAPLRGQLWYDTSIDSLKVFDGIQFVAIGGGGGGGDASSVTVDTNSFNNILSSADTDVQKALDTLDDAIGTGGVSSVNGETGAVILDASDIDAVAIAGDTMTGYLVLNADPYADLQAATKQYVDDLIDGISGGGTVPAGGTTGQHLSKKSDTSYDTEWVDAGSGGGGEFPTGTKMLFSQVSAPTGWVQVTTENDRIIRLVNDATGGQIGGTNSPIAEHTHTTAGHQHSVNAHEHSMATHVHDVNSHTHTIGSHSHSVTAHTHSLNNHTHTISHKHVVQVYDHIHQVNYHQLTVAEMPAHGHGITNGQQLLYRGGASHGYDISSEAYLSSAGTWAANGSSNGHGHGGTSPEGEHLYSTSNTNTTNSGGPSTANTLSASASTSGTSSGTTGGTTASTAAAGAVETGSATAGTNAVDLTSDGAFTPKYINIIMATKQ